MKRNKVSCAFAPNTARSLGAAGPPSSVHQLGDHYSWFLRRRVPTIMEHPVRPHNVHCCGHSLQAAHDVTTQQMRNSGQPAQDVLHKDAPVSWRTAESHAVNRKTTSTRCSVLPALPHCFGAVCRQLARFVTTWSRVVTFRRHILANLMEVKAPGEQASFSVVHRATHRPPRELLCLVRGSCLLRSFFEAYAAWTLWYASSQFAPTTLRKRQGQASAPEIERNCTLDRKTMDQSCKRWNNFSGSA